MYTNTSTFGKVISFFPVVIVYLAHFTIYISYLRFYIFDKENSLTVYKIILVCLTSLLSIMILLTHILCVFTNPGKIEIRKINQLGLNDYCLKCNRIRPFRAHHCHCCNRCILKMDHHCPWIANCVGLYNQKYFYLFLFYSTLGCFITFMGFIQKFLQIDFSQFNNLIKHYVNDENLQTLNNNLKEVSNNLNQNRDGNFIDQDVYPFIISFNTIFTFLILLGIGILFSYQTYLILNNLTSIENHKLKLKEETTPTKANQYRKANLINNFKIIMGDSFLIWFIPIFNQTIENDGYNYDINKVVINSDPEYNEASPLIISDEN